MQKRERTQYPGIYKRGDRVQVTWRNHLGQQRSKTVRTITEARQVKAAMESRRLQGELGGVSPVTLAEYAADWLETYAGRTSQGLSPESRSVYARHLRLHILPALGAAKLGAIQAPDVKKWAYALDLSRTSANCVLSTLKA